ncbi:hypothetical protein AB0M28_22530 [Streptomyces sp. NPDC051940]|uniref:hypothetical protein n=1 Tax=Streptomyces sp. NPDC051940 TaxID=3155675 RepID=UPI00343651C0
MAEHPWFEIEEPGEFDDPDGFWDFSETERAFVAELRERCAPWAADDLYGEVSRPEAEDALMAWLPLSDPADQRSLADIGVHFYGDRVRGDRLHSQLHFLPERPSAWALDATGPVPELARLSADWLESVARRPVLLYVWLHDGYAYAARYAFADRDETLVQSYAHRVAPPGQADALTAAGHVHGRGWIQTTGLPAPDVALHIRGDLEAAALPPGTSLSTHRGPLPTLWYE